MSTANTLSTGFLLPEPDLLLRGGIIITTSCITSYIVGHPITVGLTLSGVVLCTTAITEQVFRSAIDNSEAEPGVEEAINGLTIVANLLFAGRITTLLTGIEVSLLQYAAIGFFPEMLIVFGIIGLSLFILG